MGFSCLYASVT